MVAFEARLQTLNAEKDFKEDKLKEDVQQGRKMIEELSQMLSK